MNTKDSLLSALDDLRRAPDKWFYDEAGQRWTTTVGAYALTVERKAGWCEWSVKHDRFGELIAPTPAVVSTYAKAEAVDYTRAHVLGKMDEQMEAA